MQEELLVTFNCRMSQYRTDQDFLQRNELWEGRKTIEGYRGYTHSNIWTELSHRCTALPFPLSLIIANRLEGNWQWQHHTPTSPPEATPVHSLQPSSKTRFWTWDSNFQYFYRLSTSLPHCIFVQDQLFLISNQSNWFFEDIVGKILAHNKIPVKALSNNPTASLTLENKQS